VIALQAQTLGRQLDVWRPQTGVVHSVFEHAVNLIIDGELWTVLAPERPDIPFGIRLAPGHRPDTLNVRPMDHVHVRAGYVGFGSLILDCRTAACWTPSRWRPPATGMEARLASVERLARPRSWRESIGMANDVANALRKSDVELAGAVRRTLGRGPGLTPSGDDVLAGILTVLTSEVAGLAGERATSRIVCAIAPLLRSTSDVSRYLLDQAARGLPGRALHELGKALLEGAPVGELVDALELVLEIGSTSGADSCMGLIAAFSFSFFNLESLSA